MFIVLYQIAMVSANVGCTWLIGNYWAVSIEVSTRFTGKLIGYSSEEDELLTALM